MGLAGDPDLVTLTPILELPPDVQLPESVANELNMRLLWIGQQLKQLASQSGQSSAGGAGAAQASGAGMVIGTRSQRLTITAFDANNFKGEQFFETDTTLIYISAPLSAGGKGYVWKYMSGTARGLFAARLAGLGANDTGLFYYATDRKLTYQWNGSWAILVNYEPVIADTLANWTAASYNPANYAPGQQFLVATWNVTYTVESSLWTYSSGTYIAPFASRPATGFNGAALGAHDAGLLFHANDRKLTYQWSGSAWAILVTYEPVIADTLANWTLANYNPANYATGQQFLVTAWQVTYTVEGGLWTYSSGTLIAPFASRPATAFNGAALGSLDIGLQFLASDTKALQYWNGSAWIAYPAVSGAAPSGPAGGGLGGTYPNPTVVQASGNFLVLGSLTQQNLAGNATFMVNIQAGALGQVVLAEAGTAKAQFAIFAGNTFLDYEGTWNIRVGYGGPTIATFDPTGNVSLKQTLQLQGHTVASLPAITAAIACVFDALAPVVGSPVTGGGSVFCLVWNNGSQWKVFAV
jgi:hypothetical protein